MLQTSTVSQILVGCTLPRLPSPSRAESTPFFEVAPQVPLPKPGTFARFRKACASRPHFALVLPRWCWTTPRGAFRGTPELERGLEWALRCADAGEAFAIVLASGADASVGQRDRELVAAFVERLKSSGRQIVFAPRGLWEPEVAEPFCAQIGALYGFDPLEHDAPRTGPAYARVRPMGVRARLSEGLLMQIAERLSAAAERPSYVAFEADRAPQYASKLRGYLGEVEELRELDDSALEAEDELDAHEGDSGDGDDDTDEIESDVEADDER